AGKHVRFRVFLKGREISNPESGVTVLNNVWGLMNDIADRDHEPNFEGRYVNMLTVPKK
ncbi:MAG: translation initiation factor IF-3, partial [Campylobacteraceae bacterium]|nr:translation initiation factor IF-3 [Campylobacteraceae bacterium]